MSLRKSALTMQKALRLFSTAACSNNSSADPLPGSADSGQDGAEDSKITRKMVEENAVVIFARKGCCMCHVVKLLLYGHGVNPTVFHVDEQNEGKLTGELAEMMICGEEGSGNAAGAEMQFPLVFVGGELFGGLEEIMGSHISGELVPKLREARALWL